MPKYDVIVVGLGAFGSAATYHLARSGASVYGIDRYDPRIKLGSTHGDTRRHARGNRRRRRVFQAGDKMNTLWRELEARTGESL